MRIAIIKRALTLPARAGSDLHTFQMATAWVESGHEVEYFAWDLEGCEDVPFQVRQLEIEPETDASEQLQLSALQRRICRYMGSQLEEIAAAVRTINQGGFDACVACGLEELFCLDGVRTARVWYVADECVFAALSQLSLGNSLYENYALGVEAAVSLLIEALWRHEPDASWVVSETDRKWLERFTRRPADVIANGVDLDFFRPAEVATDPERLVFWGRLDYGPNEQGLEWFLGKVWEPLHQRRPKVKLSVIGFSPSEKVRRAVDRPGVELMANVPDLRPVVCRAPVAIYPFVSGGGIRNKLLEGAAMGRAMVVSPRAVDGLPAAGDGAWEVCRKPAEWVEAIDRLLGDPAAAVRLGQTARRWVEAHYTWQRAAELGEASIRTAIERYRARAA